MIKVDTSKQASQDELVAYEAFTDSIVETAKENFLKDGYLTPVVFVIFGTKEELKIAVIVAHEFMQSIESKDKLERLMRHIAHTEPLAIAMAFEAWVSHHDNPEGLALREAGKTIKVMPADDPNRKEVLMFTFETENIQRQVSFYIKRGSALEIEPNKEMNEATEFAGRFANVLKDMKKIKYN